MAYCNRNSRFWAALLVFAQLFLSLAGGLAWHAAPASAAMAQDVMIVKYHAGSYGSWVVLANVSDSDVDLSGWQMNDYQTGVAANPRWSFPDGTVMPGKSLLIVAASTGSGTAGAAERGVPVISPPANSTFNLSPGFEKIVLWTKAGEQADEFAMRAPTFAPPFYMPDGLVADEAYERVSVTDTDTADDWKKVKSGEPIPAWTWAPLMNAPSPTESPDAEKLSFDNAMPLTARVSGTDGAVEAHAVVTIYDKAQKDNALGTATATESGAFELTFVNASALSTVYVTATAPGKTESESIALTAAIVDITPPVPVAYAPVDGETGVAIDAVVQVTFQESIVASMEIHNVSIADAENVLVGGVRATVSGHQLTIEHASFERGTRYTVTVPAHAVQDEAGNANESAVVWSFRTEDAQPSTAVVALRLPNGSAVKQGDTFEVLATLNGYANVYGVQLQLEYDSSRLQLVGMPEPGAMWDGRPQARTFRDADAAAGVATFAGMLAGEAEGMSGMEPVSVASFRFKAIGAPGTASVGFLQGSVKVAAHPDTGSVVIVPSVSGPAVLAIEPGQSPDAAQLGLTADESEPKSGQPFTVSVDARDYSGVYGAQFQLKYDPARLQLQDANEAKEGVQVKAGTLFGELETIEVHNEVVDGTVTFASMLRGDAEGVSGSGPASVAELVFIPVGTTLGEVSVELVAEHAKLAGTPTGDPSTWQLPVAVTGSPLSVKVVDGTAPMWPAGSKLEAQPITETGVTLHWPEATDNVGVTGYTLYRNGQAMATVTDSVYEVAGLTAGTTYTFKVEAVDGAGNESVDGPSIVVTTLGASGDVEPPKWPAGSELEAQPITETGVTLAWPEATDNVGVTGYTLYRDGAALATVTGSVYEVVGLTAGTTYTFKVEAVDGAGNETTDGPSVVVTTLGTSADTEAPTWPHGAKLEVSDVSSASVRLNWPEAIDNVGIAGYRVYVGDSYLTTVTGAVYHTVSGLTANTAYTFKVSAIDAAGNASDALSVQATTRSSGGGGGGGGGAAPGNPGTPASWLAVTKRGLAMAQASIRTSKDGDATIASVEADRWKEAFERMASLPADAQRLILTIGESEPKVEWQLPADALAGAAKAMPNAVIELQVGGVSYELPLRLVDFDRWADALGAELGEMQLSLTMRTLTGSEREQLQSGMDGVTLLAAAEFILTVEGGGSSRTIDDFEGTMVKRSFALPTGTGNSRLTGVRIDDGTPAFVPTVFQNVDGIRTAVILSPTNSIYGVAQYRKSFADVAGHWSRADVELLASKLIVQGVSDDAFAPDADITRAEFAALLVRALGLPIEDDGAAAYTDVSPRDWFAGVVGAASRAGLIRGFEDGSFKPEDKITREQMALMLSRALEVAGKPVTAAAGVMDGYADRDEVSAWAREAVGQALEAGIMGGMSETGLEPKRNATRAQATAMLKRYLTFVGYMNR